MNTKDANCADHRARSAVLRGIPTAIETAQISAAVGEILARLDAEVAARRPVCRASGRCCKFEAYGHRLYVTGVELTHFAMRHVAAGQSDATERPGASTRNGSKTVSLEQFFGQPSPAGCPFQVEGLCTAREARPLGCRIYFCDETAQAWQEEVYERYHSQLKEVHARFGVPYRYLEWRAGLRELLAG